MAFKQKRDFGHYSEIRQGILKKIKNVLTKMIVKRFLYHILQKMIELVVMMQKILSKYST